MNQDSSFQVISFPKALASGNENGGKRGERGGGGRRRGKGVAYTYSVFYFVSVSRLQQKESGSHHKFKRNG